MDGIYSDLESLTISKDVIKGKLDRVAALCRYAMQAAGIATALLAQRKQDEIVITQALRQAEVTQEAVAAALTDLASLGVSVPTVSELQDTPPEDIPAVMADKTFAPLPDTIPTTQDHQRLLHLLEEAQEVVTRVHKARHRTVAAHVPLPAEENTHTDLLKTLAELTQQVRREMSTSLA